METKGEEVSADSGKLKFWDLLFLLFLSSMMAAVAWVGLLSYHEGQKTELIKRHAESWGDFFTANTERRAQDGYDIEACAAKPESPTTWGDCYQALVAPGGPMDGKENPFIKGPQKLAAQCNSSARNLAGSLVLEKISPLPPGSAVPVVASPLGESEPLDKKLTLRISVCDKFASPIVVGEFQF